MGVNVKMVEQGAPFVYFRVFFGFDDDRAFEPIYLIELPQNNHISFKDIRQKIEEYQNLPFEEFVFAVTPSVMISPNKEHWEIKDFDLFDVDIFKNRNGDGSLYHPHSVFVEIEDYFGLCVQVQLKAASSSAFASTSEKNYGS